MLAGGEGYVQALKPFAGDEIDLGDMPRYGEFDLLTSLNSPSTWIVC